MPQKAQVVSTKEKRDEILREREQPEFERTKIFQTSVLKLF